MCGCSLLRDVREEVGSLAEPREAEAGGGSGYVKANVTFMLVVNGGQCVWADFGKNGKIVSLEH